MTRPDREPDEKGRAASRWTRRAPPRSRCCGRSASARHTPTWRCPHCCGARGITGRDAAFATELTYGTCRTLGLLDAVIGAAAGRSPEAIDPVLLDLLRLGTYQLLRTRVGRARGGVHHRRTGRHRIRFGASGFRQRRVAHHRRARRAVLGRRAGSRPRRPIRSGMPRSCTLTRAGSPRPSPTRWARRPENSTRHWQATTNGRSVHLAARPGALTAAELADSGARHRRPLFALCGVPAGRRPRTAGPGARRPGAGPGRGQPIGGPGADAGTGRRRRRTMAGPVRRAGRQDRVAGRARAAGIRGPGHGGGAGAASRGPGGARTPAGCRSTCVRADGRHTDLEPGFDRVLVDVPCTGLGALRRRPEARWRRQPADVPALAKLQRELLAAAIALTRPGGVVLYATCSPHLAETIGRGGRCAAPSPGVRAGHPAVVRAGRRGCWGTARYCAALAAPARHRRHVRRRAAAPDVSVGREARVVWRSCLAARTRTPDRTVDPGRRFRPARRRSGRRAPAPTGCTST